MKNGSLGISSGQLRRAVAIKQKIERLESDLEKLLGGKGVTSRVSRPGGTRVMSAAGKARIAAAQKQRWAKWRKKGLSGDGIDG
jgi:hypothetical protein